MIIGRIQGATRVLGKPIDWDQEHPDTSCGSLPILDVGPEHGGPFMVSAWFPSPEEVERLRAGQPIYLSVYGSVHPPVALWVPEISNQESKG